MRAHVIQPDGSFETFTFSDEPGSEWLRDQVGGWIELVNVLHRLDPHCDHFEGDESCDYVPVHMIVNEESALFTDRKINPIGTRLYHEGPKQRGMDMTRPNTPQIYGTVVVLEGKLT